MKSKTPKDRMNKITSIYVRYCICKMLMTMQIEEIQLIQTEKTKNYFKYCFTCSL